MTPSAPRRAPAALRLALLLPLLALALPARAADSAADLEFFEAKVRPILANTCYKCHSAKSEKLKGGLHVDTRAGLLAGGDTAPAVVPGDPAKSLLIEAVSYTNSDLQMPPKSKLSAQQIADLTTWVQHGAAWPAEAAVATTSPGAVKPFDLAGRKKEWWAWQPIVAATPPAVTDPWCHGDIDRFILAKLQTEKLKPAPAADRRTLIRRLNFDLIGLPPTPAEVEAFVADTSPKALEVLVDRLLASPHFGERWGRHWLDLVRYADSRGHEFDYTIPNAWVYRDYVIRAFNADLPYDRFLTEQIAGDLLPQPRTNPTEGFNESVLGTGFWLLGEGVHSPVDIRQDQGDRIDNMIDVLGKTFMGLTIACARCHDHKFDAIAAKDYYGLAGILESSTYRQVRFDTDLPHRAIADSLDKLRRQAGVPIAKAFADGCKPVLDKLDAYLLAARDALRSAPLAAGGPDEVFADFESGTYTGWTATGTAFGNGPRTLETISGIQGKINGVGRYFVNTYCHETNGDDATGTLTSNPFTITKPYLNMLVGGGDYAGETCVDLVIDGARALTATGRRDNHMFPVTWDLRPFKGKQACIRMVDQRTGPWGNIGCDQIVFSDAPSDAGTVPQHVRPDNPVEAARIASLAKERNLDPATLTAWISHLSQVADKPGDPFTAWGRLALDPTAKTDELYPAPQPPAAEAAAVIDYANAAEDWLPDSVSYGPGPLRAGELRLGSDPLQPIAAVATFPMAAADPAWLGLKRAPGTPGDPLALDYERSGHTLTTRSFVLDADQVHIFMRGTAHIYAPVGQHALINGPLHGQLVHRVETHGAFEWTTMDLRVYKGLSTHLEFTAESPDFAVVRVVVADNQPPRPAAAGRALASALAAAKGDPTALAAAYRQALGSVATRLGTGGLAGSPDAQDVAPLADWLVGHAQLFGQGRAPLAAAQPFQEAQTKLLAGVKLESRLALALMDGSGADSYVMKRGSWRNHGDPAPRQLLEAIAGADQPRITKGSGRLELAKRMTDAKDPFTARVMVNRLWHHLFGRGIVPSVDNFGVLGGKPSNPALLDYLATSFVKNGWSVKQAIRAMVLSATYQQTSVAEADADRRDPDDQWLHRMPIRRLEAEAVRDNILAVSGRLDTNAMGGPSVPLALTEFMEGRGRPDNGPLDGNGRRSVYLAIRRNFLSPMLMAFDAPTPFNTMGRRSVSNVPAQALTLMNDPLVITEARRWAERVLAEPGSGAEERIARMWATAFARPPQPDEVKAVLAFLKEHGAALGGDEKALWADLAHALMNSKEFIFIN